MLHNILLQLDLLGVRHNTYTGYFTIASITLHLYHIGGENTFNLVTLHCSRLMIEKDVVRSHLSNSSIPESTTQNVILRLYGYAFISTPNKKSPQRVLLAPHFRTHSVV